MSDQHTLKGPTPKRWWILGILFLATFINYFDRQTLGNAMDPIAEEFGLSSVQRGNLLAAFTLTYAITHLFIGYMIDRFKNIKRFFAINGSWLVNYHIFNGFG